MQIKPDDVYELAKSILNVRQAGFQEGLKVPKRYCIHEIGEIIGDRIVDNDGHWDGEAFAEFKVKAVIPNASSKVDWADLTLSIDADNVRKLIVKLNKWMERIEGIKTNE